VYSLGVGVLLVTVVLGVEHMILGDSPKNEHILSAISLLYLVCAIFIIATGVLITALHNAGLSALTHTPAPMTFLNQLCKRPEQEKPVMILVTGHPADDATIPEFATVKKSLRDISSEI